MFYGAIFNVSSSEKEFSKSMSSYIQDLFVKSGFVKTLTSFYRKT
ncbi:hypothetical protein LEP1GSC170_0107 [Leptospira interrogans serovar Bataviae str. HAI135]|nr:hypothetical protein LEP1GSC170_0107 [Leptospira interrogans serovar Bataviae str. HAI135]